MKVSNLIEEVKTLSGRDDLPDSTARFFLNMTKLQFQRRYVSVELAKHTLPIVAAVNKRSSDLPSDFLAFQDSGIRRQTPTHATSQVNVENNIKYQSLERYDLHMHFENDYPEFDSSNNLILGHPIAYHHYGTSVLWGPIPIDNETLFLDYFRKLPEYTDVHEEDIFTDLGFDFLLFGALEYIFRTWTKNIPEANVWKSLKDEEAGSLQRMQVFQEVSGATITLPMPQQSFPHRSGRNRRSRYDG